MTDVFWNYDLTQCPDEVCQFKVKEMRFPVIGKGSQPSRGRFFVGWAVYPEAWAPYTPPSEPKVWIKHDDTNWPDHCKPNDDVEVKFKDGEKSIAKAKAFPWDGRIDSYRVIEKDK